MKRTIAIVLSVALFLGSSTAIFAQNSDVEISRLASGVVVNKDYFAANETVEILGTVNGDVYVAGGKVIINGVINGDVLVAGGVVTIGGLVTNDVRAAGGEVRIVGSIGKNVTVAGGTVLATPESVIGGNILAFGGNIDISGTVSGNINAYTETFTLNQAAVGGDVNYWSDREALVTGNSSVSGQLMRHEADKQKSISEGAKSVGMAWDVFSTVSSMLITLILGLLVIRFIPRYTKRSNEIMQKEFGKSLFRGFLAFTIIPVVLVLIAVTILGLPLAIFGTIGFALYLYIVRIYAIVAIGSYTFRLAKNTGTLTKSFIVGLLIYYLLTLIPVVGLIVKIVVLIAALGAAVTNDRRTWAMARADHLL